MPISQPTQYQILDADQRLTNISILQLNDPSVFIASQVFPQVPVNLQAGKYVTYNSGDFNKTEMRATADGAPAPLAGWGKGEDTYFCEVYKEATIIGPAAMANTTAPFDLLRDSTMMLTNHALIHREQQFKSKYMTTGVWGTDKEGVASNPTGDQFVKWSDYANSDPIGDVREAGTKMAILNYGKRPNGMAVSRDVFDTLVEHPALIERIIYIAGSEPARLSRQHLAALFEVDSVTVLDAVANTANEGAAENPEFIFSNEALLYYRPGSPGLMTASPGYIFSWNYLSGFGGTAVRREERTMREGGGTYLEVAASYDMKVVSKDLAIYWHDVV
jgi:hypothetical protein